MKPCSHELGTYWTSRILDFRTQDQWKDEIKYLSERLDADFGLGFWNRRYGVPPILLLGYLGPQKSG
ncbi:hypothetical protein RCL_jg9669.t1 [Rhizophagus clarus]|uniref:Uncharacterized protein n=1 Tax=Rhizophagus clarus TaxID=94130 RepID=A0A8H3LUW4_9GLOM|nr:hypothetical protein RCL_jg9669.t1 [Rhizophagus clarus]